MKRNIFLSFRPEFFRPILYGIKKYEYRKRFCKESTRAYLYLSSPVQEVIGIMELGIPIMIEEAVETYSKEHPAYKRLIQCIENGEKFAIPIESLQLYKQPVSIDTIKQLEPDFFVPQCYLNIENYPKVYNYLNKQEMYEKEFTNDHNNIYEYNIGSSCREMETTEEFKRKDNIYLKDEKYKIIKSGYLLKGEK